ncbi:MAG: hypothetical protein K1X79_14430 [Oligoflexia bacterium]|nr:hypothetical protein [Oligoflexia bacterium]
MCKIRRSRWLFSSLLVLVVAYAQVPAEAQPLIQGLVEASEESPCNVLVGTKSEGAWLCGVYQHPYMDWRVEGAIAGQLCPVPLKQMVQMVRELASNKSAPQVKLNAFAIEIFPLLHPDDKPPYSCIKSALCTCEVLTVIFPGATCQVSGGTDEGGVGHAFAKATIPGIPGEIAIDSLNAIAVSIGQ